QVLKHGYRRSWCAMGYVFSLSEPVPSWSLTFYKGDEGKGKLVDILCDSVDVCARCQGGNNAGHTIVVNGVMYDFHILPSGLINPNCINLIGSGVVVNVPAFFSELKALQDKGLGHEGRIFISDRAHLVFDIHQLA